MASDGVNAAATRIDFVPAPPLSTKVAPRRDFHHDYALNEKLGHGTFAVVYAATRTGGGGGGERLAVKVIDVREASCKHLDFDDKRTRSDLRRHRSFMNEAAVLSMVTGHDHICRISERFVHGGLAYIVLERCDRTLREALEGCATLNEEVLRPFFHGMLAGLEAIHALRVVHRDIKPDNFMCSGPGNVVKLCDFGVACVLAPPDAKHNTECIGLAGTLPYMAPEMLENGEYGAKVDIWSFGVVLHVLLCGSFPYAPPEMTVTTMKAAMLQGGPTPQIFLEPSATHHTSGGISSEARHFAIRMLAINAAKRPTSREALREEFFTSASLPRSCLRGKFDAAKLCGAFDDSDERRLDIGDVDVRLWHLQERRCQPATVLRRSQASEASTDVGSRSLDECGGVSTGDRW